MFFKLSKSVILTKNKKEKLIVVCNLKSFTRYQWRTYKCLPWKQDGVKIMFAEENVGSDSFVTNNMTIIVSVKRNKLSSA